MPLPDEIKKQPIGLSNRFWQCVVSVTTNFSNITTNGDKGTKHGIYMNLGNYPHIMRVTRGRLLYQLCSQVVPGSIPVCPHPCVCWFLFMLKKPAQFPGNRSWSEPAQYSKHCIKHELIWTDMMWKRNKIITASYYKRRQTRNWFANTN